MEPEHILRSRVGIEAMLAGQLVISMAIPVLHFTGKLLEAWWVAHFHARLQRNPQGDALLEMFECSL